MALSEDEKKIAWLGGHDPATFERALRRNQSVNAAGRGQSVIADTLASLESTGTVGDEDLPEALAAKAMKALKTYLDNPGAADADDALATAGALIAKAVDSGARDDSAGTPAGTTLSSRSIGRVAGSLLTENEHKICAAFGFDEYKFRSHRARMALRR
jgi:hypothetical protein